MNLETAVFKNFVNQRGGGGFAVGTGNSDYLSF